MSKVTKDEFIANFLMRIRAVLEAKLPDEDEEFDMIRKSNDIITDDVTHITRWMR